MSDEQHEPTQPTEPTEPTGLHESPLSAADDERIRRLLAEARHTDPMPDHVAARLDRVLTGLSRERSEPDVVRASVVDLAARRRRTATNLLVAAAAVLVVGVGATQVLPGFGGSGADSPTAASQADQLEAGGANAPEDSAGGGVSRGVSSEVPSPAPSAEGAGGQEFKVRAARFGPDVRRIRDDVETVTKSPAPLYDFPKPTCVPSGTEESTVVAVSYDGAPATLVLRAPAGDVQVVDLYLCGDTTPRRSITLTAP